jgi:hypothetical protein
MKKPSQLDLLLNHFKVRDSITNIEAQAVFRMRSLSRRVCDLKSRGYKFRKDMRTDATGQRYVRYFFMGRA